MIALSDLRSVIESVSGEQVMVDSDSLVTCGCNRVVARVKCDGGQ